MEETPALTRGRTSQYSDRLSLPLAIKRLVDFSGALFGLILLSPLLFALYVLIKLDSPGPALFRRGLIGHRGEQFTAYKFRSMVIDADRVLKDNSSLSEEYRKTLKISNDPRVTRIGHMLRKTSLDELPQLFNVLRGDMSLVGPRMLGDVELARYGQAKDTVLSVKPGMTGLWQVSGRHTVSFERRMELDLCYVENWSLWLDLIILLKTPFAVINCKGAG